MRLPKPENKLEKGIYWPPIYYKATPRISSRQTYLLLLGICMLLWETITVASPTHPEIKAFIDEMVTQHGFSRPRLEGIFSKVQFQPSIINLISTPSSAIPWSQYRSRFVNPQRIKNGVSFWNQHNNILQRANQEYGIPEEIIVAIIGVETSYGASTGKHRVIDALTTLAFDFPKRAEFFRSELVQYLLLAQEQNFDLLSIRGSYAGAIGIPQFMPGSYRKFAVDFDGDGKVDLANSVADAIGSVANYLKQYGWEVGGPIVIQSSVKADHLQEILESGIEPKHTIKQLQEVSIIPMQSFENERLAALIELKDNENFQYWLGFKNFYVITRYNRSSFYAMSVHQLAEAIRNARNPIK